MASITSPSIGFTANSASELLSSSSNVVRGIPLRALGRARFNTRTRVFSVSAKLKSRMDGYPWPKDPDLNVKGGVLFHLSPFKPLKEKPKPVTLDFEKPLLDLEKKIVDVRKMANDTGLDFTDQIISLENKYQQALKDLYTHLTPIQRVSIARHPNRPTFLDHVFSITDKFVELHGDRAGYDDPAIVTGIGTIDGERYMFIGQQKGRNTKENIERNFGMPTPNGYRKALRMMEYADHHGFPIVTFIDTPGAYADIRSEEEGQGEAIAHNLRSMFGLKVPVVSIVIGEGGSGGALAIGCANKLLMLENAVFYVASPEACAAILWKTAKAAPKAAEQLRITATELCKFEIADGIIPEPLGGAHADPSWTSQQIKVAINNAMDELKKLNKEEILEHRRLKFRKLGGVQEGIPLDPIMKVNMKQREEPSPSKIPDAELVGEVEKLREQILKALESSSKIPELKLSETIEKLRKEVDHEISEAIEALGFEDRFAALREEYSKVANSQDQIMHPALIDKIEKLKDEFNQGLLGAPNYASLRSKLDMLTELSKAKDVSENSNLKQEISKRYKEVNDRPEIKEKLESIKAEVRNSGVSRFADLPESLKEKIVNVKQEIESEVAGALEGLGLNVKIVTKVRELSNQIPTLDLKDKIEGLNEEINEKIGNVINSSEIKYMLELLRLEVAKGKNSPDPASKSKIEALGKQIKQKLSDAINSSELKEKHDKLQLEISKAMESFGNSDASSGNGSLKDDSQFEKPEVEADLDAGFA